MQTLKGALFGIASEKTPGIKLNSGKLCMYDGTAAHVCSIILSRIMKIMMSKLMEHTERRQWFVEASESFNLYRQRYSDIGSSVI